MIRGLRAVAAAALFTVASIVPIASVAYADDAPPAKILLLIDPSDTRTTARLRGELEALGFEVVVQHPEGVPDRASLEAATKASGAVAAIRLSPSPRGIEVWVNDRATGKTSLREVVTHAGDEDADLVAVRAVELLRASLLELGSDHPPRGDVAVPPPALSLLPEEAPPRWYVGFHAGFVASPGGLDPSPLLAAIASVRPHDYLALRIELDTSLRAASVEGPEGAATTLLSFASVGGRAYVAPPGSVFNFYGGPALGLTWMHLEGSARPPWQGVSDDVFAPTVFFDTGIYAALARRLRVVAESNVAITLTHPTVRFAGREVAHWGRPAVVTKLGLEIGLD